MKSPELDETEPGGDLGDLREQNLRRILGTLLGARAGLTQPRIVDLTDLSRSTVSYLLGHHLEGVLQVGTIRNGENSGRPVKAWRIDDKACLSIGIDIGQTHVSVVLINPFGEVVGGPLRKPMGDVLDEPHRTLSLATELVEELVGGDGVCCEDIAAVTVGLPGPVDMATGAMADDHATQAWAGMDVRAEIRKRWPHESVPKRLADNNANLGALAEHRFGAGRGCQSLIYLDWSSGIGSGLLLGGQIWRGHSGFAGEVGHLPVSASADEIETLHLPADRADWQACRHCRQADCLNRLAGGLTVSRAVGLPDLSAVVNAALSPENANSAKAREVLSVAARLIGKAIGPALTLLNPNKVILGGAVGEPALYPLLVEDLSAGIKKTAFPRARTDASLEIGALGSDAPVLGAALLGVDQHGVDFLINKAMGETAAAELQPKLEKAASV